MMVSSATTCTVGEADADPPVFRGEGDDASASTPNRLQEATMAKQIKGFPSWNRGERRRIRQYSESTSSDLEVNLTCS